MSFWRFVLFLACGWPVYLSACLLGYVLGLAWSGLRKGFQAGSEP